MNAQSDQSKLVGFSSHWFRVPRVVATRHRAQQLREQAVDEGANVLDFAGTWFISGSAADELLNGPWEATTGESEDVRRVVVRAHERQGRYVTHLEGDHAA